MANSCITSSHAQTICTVEPRNEAHGTLWASLFTVEVVK